MFRNSFVCVSNIRSAHIRLIVALFRTQQIENLFATETTFFTEDSQRTSSHFVDFTMFITFCRFLDFYFFCIRERRWN